LIADLKLEREREREKEKERKRERERERKRKGKVIRVPHLRSICFQLPDIESLWGWFFHEARSSHQLMCTRGVVRCVECALRGVESKYLRMKRREEGSERRM
jgi:hypothetical protein